MPAEMVSAVSEDGPHVAPQRHPPDRGWFVGVWLDGRDSCEFCGISHRESIWGSSLNSRPGKASRENQSTSDGEEEWKPIASTASAALTGSCCDRATILGPD